MAQTKTVSRSPEYIKPWEKVLKIKEVEFSLPEKEISLTSALEKITGKPITEIDKGTIFASAGTKSASSSEFHKFETLFGRDSLITALDLKDIFPKLLKNTVLTLAKCQGEEYVPHKEEEPGKIVHESRKDDDPIAQRLSGESGWQFPYYGSLDATILYLLAVLDIVEKEPKFFYIKYKSKSGKTKNIKDSFISGIDFILKKTKDNPEGLLEFRAGFMGSIENQVWKDSFDSYHHQDGTLANHKQGIASIEVQALAYDVFMGVDELNIPSHLKKELKIVAGNLKDIVLKKFWVEDKRGGYFALGSDRDEKGHLRLLKVRTSNMGWLLQSGILSGNDSDITKKKKCSGKNTFFRGNACRRRYKNSVK